MHAFIISAALTVVLFGLPILLVQGFIHLLIILVTPFHKWELRRQARKQAK